MYIKYPVSSCYHIFPHPVNSLSTMRGATAAIHWRRFRFLAPGFTSTSIAQSPYLIANFLRKNISMTLTIQLSWFRLQGKSTLETGMTSIGVSVLRTLHNPTHIQAWNCVAVGTVVLKQVTGCKGNNKAEIGALVTEIDLSIQRSRLDFYCWLLLTLPRY